MIAHQAQHPGLSRPECDIVGQSADIEVRIVVATWIAAVDEHARLALASYAGERGRLLGQEQIFGIVRKRCQSPRVLPHPR
jgi:hypothetical protein